MNIKAGESNEINKYKMNKKMNTNLLSFYAGSELALRRRGWRALELRLRRLGLCRLTFIIFVAEVSQLLHHRLLLGQLVASVQVQLVFLQGQRLVQLENQGVVC